MLRQLSTWISPTVYVTSLIKRTPTVLVLKMLNGTPIYRDSKTYLPPSRRQDGREIRQLEILTLRRQELCESCRSKLAKGQQEADYEKNTFFLISADIFVGLSQTKVKT